METINIKEKGLQVFEIKKIKIAGTYMNYAEGGKGRTLILVHGWTNNWTGWIPVGLRLRKKFRVIIIDLPGFGDSGKLKKYTFEAEANCLNDFIRKKKIENPILIGHSMGTYVLAKYYSLYPKIAKKIIMIAPMFRRNNKVKRLKMSELFFRVMKKTDLGTKVVKKVINTNTFSYLSAKMVNMYKFDKSIIDTYGIDGKKKTTNKAYVELGVEILTTNIDDLIENNRIPINLIFGKYDKLTNADTAKKILKNRGNYRIVTVDKAGHLITVERPVETARVIERLVEN